jgi:hypothetical protein
MTPVFEASLGSAPFTLKAGLPKNPKASLIREDIP